MATLSEETIQKLLQQVEKGDLQSALQTLQTAQQTGGSLSADSKGLGYEKVIDDIGTDEAFKSKTFGDAEMWGINKKLLVAREQSEAQKSFDYDKALKEIELKSAQVELARKEHGFAHQQKLDNLQVRVAEQAELVKTMLNVEYAKFNSAQSEPISPNTGE